MNVHVPGVNGARAFSLATPPEQRGIVELHVRRVDGGAATRYLHDRLQAGDELRLQRPLGRFFVRTSKPAPRIFVAGSGLSSMRSMLLERIASGCTIPITLIHGARSASELYDRDVFTALAGAHPTFRYVSAVSSGEALDGIERGFAHEVLERLYGARFAGNGAYLCGPPPMVEACIRVLMKGRLFEKDIFTERFVTHG